MSSKQSLDLFAQPAIASAGFIKKRSTLLRPTLQRGVKKFIESLPVFRTHG
jgi:hypothetical protein